MSEPEPAPDHAQRRYLVGLGIVWIAVSVLVPLRYYVVGDPYDERFAWRMFSRVRTQSCELSASETRHGVETGLALYEILPAPWVSLLERDRAAVVDRFLAWRCRTGEDLDSVRIENACRAASGDVIPTRVREITCESGTIVREERTP